MEREAEKLQEMADKNDTHGLHSELRAIYGPRTNAVAPVKTVDGIKYLHRLRGNQREMERTF